MIIDLLRINAARLKITIHEGRASEMLAIHLAGHQQEVQSKNSAKVAEISNLAAPTIILG